MADPGVAFVVAVPSARRDRAPDFHPVAAHSTLDEAKRDAARRLPDAGAVQVWAYVPAKLWATGGEEDGHEHESGLRLRRE